MARSLTETNNEAIKKFSFALVNAIQRPDTFRIANKEKWYVSGKIPLFSSPSKASAIEADPWKVLAVLVVDAGPVLLDIDLPASTQIAVNVSAYQAYKTHRIESREQIADIERRLKEVAQNFSNEAKRARNYSIATEKALGDLDDFKLALIEEKNAALSNLNLHVDEGARRVQKLSEEFHHFLAKGQEQIDAAAKSTVEAGILGEAIAVWKKKVVAHRVLFWVGLGILFGGFIAFAQNAPALWLEYGQSFRRTEAGDIPYTELIGLLAGLGAIIWLTRIIVRLVFTAQALADDAVQRRAFLETYLRLVRDPDAKMETSDRILVLNAIFRPLPGHQTEDVAPPTIADLIRERLPK
jgi:hypothetical protein